MKSLPRSIQISPTDGLLTDDINKDGNMDVMMVGNSYANDGFVGRDDAGSGACLLGDGKGSFQYVGNDKTGFRADKDAKSIGSILVGSEEYLMISNNNGPVESYRFKRDSTIVFHKLNPMDAYAMITLRDGIKYKQEFYYGGSYLAQSSRYLKINPNMEHIVVVQYNGTSRTLDAHVTAK